MRIATWNVNSLAARLEKVWWWLERARPDVLLLQETKLNDGDAPHAAFLEHGYQLTHHGQGRWNGVAIASKGPVSDVITNFGQLPAGAVEGDPLSEARMVSGVCGGVRVVSIYAPNGRALDSPHYLAKLNWYAALHQWLVNTRQPSEPLVIGGDFNIAPTDADVWDAAACHGGTHVSVAERAALARLTQWGLTDAYRLHQPAAGRYSWWDYRAGNFHKNFGMRIDLLLASEPAVRRVVWAEIDREARKGKPIPSDHAPVLVDLDEHGVALDAGWEAAAQRVAARRRK